MDIATFVTSIVTGLTTGISDFAEGLGAGLKDLITALLFETNGSTTTLSTFAIVSIAFGGVALAVGLSRWVMNWVSGNM